MKPEIIESVITEAWLDDVCLLGHGEATCAFLMLGGDGFGCAKGTSAEATIRARLEAGTMNARGNNCDGWGGR